MIELPGYETIGKLSGNEEVVLYRLRRSSDGQYVLGKTTCDEYPQQLLIDSFHYEFDLLHKLDGRGTAKTYGLQMLKNRPVLLLHDDGGITLDQFLHSGSEPLDLTTFLEIAIEIIRSLMILQRENMTLHEIIPLYIYVNPAAKSVRFIDLRLCSSGLNQSPLSSRSRPESVLPYMSPEQTGRTGTRPDFRTDYYSFGITLYELLSGSLPFDLQDVSNIVYRHIARTPEPLHHRYPSIPVAVSDIVTKCIQKAPEARYSSAYGIKYDLEECLFCYQTSGKIDSLVPGSHDVPERWSGSIGYYGRQAEQQQLLAVLDQVSDGAAQVVWVQGEWGIGKTSFVQRTVAEHTSNEGFFAQSRSASNPAASPFDVWIQLIDDLLNRLFMESKVQIEVWRLRILEVLDGLGQLLIDLVPRLELLIGVQPSVLPLPSLEAQQRLHMLMNRFIQVFAQQGHPLILFMDDLQWMDEASLQYLIHLLNNPELKHTLVVLACREMECSAAAADSAMLLQGRLKSAYLKSSTVLLRGLDPVDIRQLLKDKLQYEASEDERLVRTLFYKTGGNPLLLQRLLQDLVAERRIFFDEETRGWRWDLLYITGMSVPGNASSYVADRMKALSEEHAGILGQAACLGNSFSLELLSLITGRTAEEFKEMLDFAIQEHFILISEYGAGYQFLDDDVRQEAYKLLPEAERQKIHLRFGRYLAGQLHHGNESEVFPAVNHLNKALELLDEPWQRRQAVELNLQAGLKAKQATAYETALIYLRNASGMLTDESWDCDYVLTFQIYRERAEAEFLCAHVEEADQLFSLLLHHAQSSQDKAYVYMIKLQLEASHDHHEEVISLGMRSLELLGVKHAFEPGTIGLILRLLRVGRMLRQHSPNTVCELPAMTDEVRKAAMTILVYTSNASFHVNQKGWVSSICTMIEMTLNDGITPEASIGFTGYALLLHFQFKRDEEAFKWGMMACRLAERYPVLYSKALTSFSLCMDSWRQYDPGLLNTFREYAGKVGLESGDLWQGNQSVLISGAMLLIYGHPLGDIYERLLLHSGDFLRHNNSYHLKQIAVFTAVLARLTGYRSANDPFASIDITSEEFVQLVHGDEFHIIQELVYIYQYLVGYILGEYQQAEEALEQAAVIAKFRLKKFDYIIQDTYESLVWAQLYEQASVAKQRQYRAGIRQRLKKLKKFADRCPQNNLHKYQLVKAELDRILGKWRQAEEGYEQAIGNARSYSHIHDLAIAAECYGRYWLRKDRVQLAKHYLLEAYEAYSKWGAAAKVTSMEQQYGYLLHSRRQQGLENIDYLSVMQSAQAISGEMEMNRLLHKLMSIMLHNAGADLGALLFDHNGRWVIEAYGSPEDLRIESIPYEEDSALIPAAIIGYAGRTKEEIVLHDAAKEGMFARDRYVREQGLKSVICLPIMYQNKMVCLLYMENRLSTGVFTPERLDILKLLGSQCAISIANAGLYTGIQMLKDSLEQQVAERTSSLEQSMHETAVALAEVSIYEERNRIAQEIHDIVGHTLTSTILQIEAGRRLFFKDAEAASERLKEAQELVRHSLNEIRGAVHMLKEDKHADFLPILRQLIRDTERNTGVVIHAAIYEPPELSQAQKKTIYHALQEGLTNGIRHGGSTEFHFSLRTVGSNIEFKLKDQGQGAEQPKMGFGLKAMKDRVEQLGGSLAVNMKLNQGCEIVINLPYASRWIGEKV
ncbi:BREX system ATP-binding domain-containing protein [Paenibacillus sp. GM2]|uniref:BREX system ATP-binding domain-containing protein n=1 Tax=Paenibacillus sp. GM2 TaxID=1622070 RepID=UPI0008380503|nr:BREX system ATP-binding domain-containing protein [Paenibacillus sp. GM2]